MASDGVRKMVWRLMVEENGLASDGGGNGLASDGVREMVWRVMVCGKGFCE